ncbi:hypothetical protein DPMN_008706 [Dreissena polymorpha]|uniref:Uncharacterized protein n=1 Tax=Dreissena polymorpha TaxID=45954 RepID=A0A9D4K2K5_DREPO|nr:hypothetical protein DPMN_103232 [Dreissena polymorpha]KAH3884720.1 hypothetical protein DPMN_008706 [Dreissena polymorpha]
MGYMFFAGRIDEANKRLTIDLCGSWIRPEPISNATMQLLMEFKNKTVNCPPRIVPS